MALDEGIATIQKEYAEISKELEAMGQEVR